MSGTSTRPSGLPISFHSDSGLSFGSFGTSSFAASAATSPYASFLPEAWWCTAPSCARHSPALTPQRAAAAPTSISRAAAPAWRSGTKFCRTERLPSVFWSPYFLSPSACTISTWPSETSSSSASSIAIDVRAPWPISERWTMSRIALSVPTSTNTLGAKAGAAPEAAVAAENSASGRNESTRPAAVAPAVVPRNSRRETFCKPCCVLIAHLPLRRSIRRRVAAPRQPCAPPGARAGRCRSGRG